MDYFKLPQSGLNSALERIQEISKLTGLVTGIERSDQIRVKNALSSFTDTLSAVIQKQKFSNMIDQIAQEHKVDPKLVKAVIEKESRYNPSAVSTTGAMGLMQLMPGTAREMGVTNPLDPVDNIRGGTKYLSSLLNRYHGNVTLALSAYNAGPRNVDKYKGIPPFAETQNYVKEIMEKIA